MRQQVQQLSVEGTKDLHWGLQVHDYHLLLLHEPDRRAAHRPQLRRGGGREGRHAVVFGRGGDVAGEQAFEVAGRERLQNLACDVRHLGRGRIVLFQPPRWRRRRRQQRRVGRGGRSAAGRDPDARKGGVEVEVDLRLDVQQVGMPLQAFVIRGTLVDHSIRCNCRTTTTTSSTGPSVNSSCSTARAAGGASSPAVALSPVFQQCLLEAEQARRPSHFLVLDEVVELGAGDAGELPVVPDAQFASLVDGLLPCSVFVQLSLQAIGVQAREFLEVQNTIAVRVVEVEDEFRPLVAGEGVQDVRRGGVCCADSQKELGEDKPVVFVPVDGVEIGFEVVSGGTLVVLHEAAEGVQREAVDGVLHRHFRTEATELPPGLVLLLGLHLGLLEEI
mmetsp:Transcript_63647/g.207671  ORF Transcript_63647/g.207671 Transcript_63647/m.207671 type:complete len:389 (-) Transcript_63647:287-1453(-)